MVEEMDVDPHPLRNNAVPVEQFTAAKIGGAASVQPAAMQARNIGNFILISPDIDY